MEKLIHGKRQIDLESITRDLRLYCSANRIPLPEIKWKRESMAKVEIMFRKMCQDGSFFQTLELEIPKNIPSFEITI